MLVARAARTLESNILPTPTGASLPWHPYRGISPGASVFRGVWNWDSAFHALAVSRWDGALAREQVEMFLAVQQPSGLLPDLIWEAGGVVTAFGKPPVFPWAVEHVDRRRPDLDFIARTYANWVAYEAFWRRERGGDRDGLFHYDSSTQEPADKRLTEIRYESGWDNSPRWDQGIVDVWPVDLNAFMVMAYRALDYLATRLGKEDDAREWCSRGQALAARIEQRLFDERTGSYQDFNFTKNEFNGVLSPASFMPLYIGSASSDRAAALAKIAADPNKFFPGLPTVAYDHPAYSQTYWRGPTWLNVAYFMLMGLKRYGYVELADTCRQTLLGWCASHDRIYECYDARTGKGLYAPDFGWSSAMVIELILDW